MTQLRWHYAHGKLSEALGSMAESSQTLAKRFADAYSAFILRLMPVDFPEELRADVERLRSIVAMRRPRWDGETSVHATVAEMHPSKVKKLIQELASWEYRLAHVYCY